MRQIHREWWLISPLENPIVLLSFPMATLILPLASLPPPPTPFRGLFKTPDVMYSSPNVESDTSHLLLS